MGKTCYVADNDWHWKRQLLLQQQQRQQPKDFELLLVSNDLRERVKGLAKMACEETILEEKDDDVVDDYHHLQHVAVDFVGSLMMKNVKVGEEEDVR